MTKSRVCTLGILVAASSLGLAQDSEDYHHQNVTVGIGPAIPVANSANYLTTAPMVTVGYGYRFNRWFQVDAGLDFVFGAANNQNAEISDFGAVQGGDHEFMIPLGGRVFVPTPFKRFDVSVGAGTSYLER